MDNYITSLLNLKGFSVNSCNEFSEKFVIEVSTSPKPSRCPSCGASVSRIHDYRNQAFLDLPIHNKPVYLLLRKRRYRCNCGKRFFENYPMLPRYHRMSNRLAESVIHELRSHVTFKSVAKKYSVSTNTVTRIFNLVNYSPNTLPSVLSIDEFKGNTGNEKYQAILTDPQNQKIVDIVSSREKSVLFRYFNGFRDKKRVKTVIMDMWEPYKDLAQYFFPDAMIIIDKYHYVRQVYWALDKVRKRVQKRLYKEKRIYFKRSKRLLWADYDKLDEENRLALGVILNHDKDLYEAWELKEIFNEFRKTDDVKEAENWLRKFILAAEETGLQEYKDAIRAFRNWFPYIINSKREKYTNAFTEGKNNKIKVLKRISYGYRNFKRFRNRILHCG